MYLVLGTPPWGRNVEGERQIQGANSKHILQGMSRVTWDKTHESCIGRTAVLFPGNTLVGGRECSGAQEPYMVALAHV